MATLEQNWRLRFVPVLNNYQRAAMGAHKTKEILTNIISDFKLSKNILENLKRMAVACAELMDQFG